MQLDSTSYKTDYLLIPKEEEEHLLRPYTPPPTKIVPRTMDYPPLMREILIRQMKAQGQPVTEPKLTVKYNFTNKFNLIRLAEEGEKPDYELKIGLEREKYSELFKYIKE